MQYGVLTWLVAKYTEVREHHSLRVFGRLMHDPFLFHLNERSVPGAFAVGLFCAWIPVPFQMILAAGLAILFRVNVPLSMILVWVTNPVTMPPMFYAAYLVGAWIMGGDIQHFAFEPTLEWIQHSLDEIGRPFLLGCLLLGIISAVAGWFVMRYVWNARLSRLVTLRVERYQRRRQRLLSIIKDKGKSDDSPAD